MKKQNKLRQTQSRRLNHFIAAENTSGLNLSQLFLKLYGVPDVRNDKNTVDI